MCVKVWVEMCVSVCICGVGETECECVGWGLYVCTWVANDANEGRVNGCISDWVGVLACEGCHA